MKRSSPLLALVVASVTVLALGASHGSAARERASADPSLHIVLLEAPPLAAYRGGIAGLAATDPTVTGARRLDARSAASRAYLAHLRSRQTDQLTSIGAALGRTVQAVHRYDAVLNGFAVALSGDEAQRVASLPGVARVVPDSILELKTDVGPTWIGAPGIWNGTATGGVAGTKGEGMLVGVIDTGINHDHPSFADPSPGDGYAYSPWGLPSGTGYRGVCDPVTGAPLCNDKLVGVYDFTGTTPLDDNGHGSHTASTAAGNVLDAEIIAPTMTLNRAISGVAPHARVISYKACVTAGTAGACPQSGTVGGINQATLDGVDVINFSIGGLSRDPWTDVNAIAFLNARRAGIFLAVSAGNEGPGRGTVGSPADSPWVTAVAASTHNRLFSNSLTGLSGGGAPPPPTLMGKGITIGHGPAPVVYAGDHGSALCGSGPAEAATNPWAPGTFNGEIVVCDRGTYGRVQKGQFLKEAGAGGYVLANDEASGESVVGDTHHLPAVNITYADGITLKAWLAQGSGHTGSIGGLVTDESPSNGDVMAAFSSRGPDPSVPGVLKPDVTAPGVDILAAFNTPAGSIGAPPEYNSISGTSMSGPHTAGAATLLRALHPAWTPDEVRSALVTTAFNSPPGDGAEAHGLLKEDSTTGADPFDVGGGRVELRRAARAGLVLEVSPDDYAAADPAAEGDPTTLNLPTLAQDACATTCTWTRVVKGSAAGAVTWTASAAGANGLALSVTPASFTLAPGATQTITVSADASALGGSWTFGRVVLRSGTSGVPDATLPVAVRRSDGQPDVPTLTLHFHGNAAATGADHESGQPDEGFCTGDGKSDLIACSGPMLLESPNLSPSPAASWKGGPAEWGLEGANDRTIYDPNWAWCLRQDDPTDATETQCPAPVASPRGETTLEGPMTVRWWAQCALTCAAVGTSWEVRLWADGVLAHMQQVDVGTAPTGIPTLLEATVNLPRLTADHRYTLQLEPVFLVDQGVEFTISYDSTQPCAPTSAGACDSTVDLPVVSEGEPSVPDLVVQNVATAGAGGNSTTITATVANQGTAAAAASKTKVVLDDSTVLATVDTPLLGPGQTAEISVDWNTAGVKGEHRIAVTADEAAAVGESDEGNNVGTLTVTVKGNKVQNGSFEQSSSGSSPDHWTSSGETTYEQGGSDGERSASAGPGGGWTSDPIAVTPGAAYDLEVAVAGAAGGVAVDQLSATGQVLRTLTVPVSGLTAGVFGLVTASLTAGSDAAAVRIRLSGPLLGTTHFDDVRLWER